jgi:hypothetical protein
MIDKKTPWQTQSARRFLSNIHRALPYAGDVVPLGLFYLRNYLFTQLPNYLITQLPNYPITQLPFTNNQHQLTKFECHLFLRQRKSECFYL